MDNAAAPSAIRRRYRFPLSFVLAWLLTPPGAVRSLARDARSALRAYPTPRLSGLEHVPGEGPFVLVANHYSRDGLGIWWTTLALSQAVATRSTRPQRWMAIDRLEEFRVLGGLPVPSFLSALALRIIGARYRMLLVSRTEVQSRMPMLREARRALHQDGEVVALYPEGIRSFSGGVLAEAFDSSGHVLAWLSDGKVPVLPAAVHDDEAGAIHVRFGEPMVLDRRELRGTDATTLVMRRVAALLPEDLHGAYAVASS